MATALGIVLSSPASWWRGFPVMAGAALLAALPLALFPASLPGAPPEPEEAQKKEEYTLGDFFLMT